MSDETPKVPAPSHGSPRALQGWLIVMGVIVLAGTIAEAFAPEAWKPAPVVVVAVAVFGTLILSWRKSVVEKRLRKDARHREKHARALAKAERDRSAILFGYNLREVLNTIDGLAKLPRTERFREIAAVRQSAVVQTKDGVGAQDARAAYFRLTAHRPGARRMEPDKVASTLDREDTFTTVFDERDPRDQDVWSILDGRVPTAFVADVTSWVRQRGDAAGPRAYGTFITTRVEAGGVPLGILTVNAIRPGSLLREDRIYVEAIARVLGIAELLCLVDDDRKTPTQSAPTPILSDDNKGGADE